VQLCTSDSTVNTLHSGSPHDGVERSSEWGLSFSSSWTYWHYRWNQSCKKSEVQRQRRESTDLRLLPTANEMIKICTLVQEQFPLFWAQLEIISRGKMWFHWVTRVTQKWQLPACKKFAARWLAIYFVVLIIVDALVVAFCHFWLTCSLATFSDSDKKSMGSYPHHSSTQAWRLSYLWG
jgi:hypothetical protein